MTMFVWNPSLVATRTLPVPAASAHERLSRRLSVASREARGHLAGGRVGEAAARLAPELTRLRSRLAPDEPAVMEAHITMGVIAKLRGDFDLAQRHYEKVARSRSARHDSGLRADLEHNLAALAHSRGQLEAAERHSREAHGLHVERRGQDHADALTELVQLGAILCERGATEEALQALFQAYDGFVALYGPDHLEVGRATVALAAVRHRMGDLAIAECLYREGIDISLHAGGGEQPELAWALANLSAVLRQAGEPAEADRVVDRAVAVLTGSVASDHPLLVKLQQRRTRAA